MYTGVATTPDDAAPQPAIDSFAGVGNPHVHAEIATQEQAAKDGVTSATFTARRPA